MQHENIGEVMAGPPPGHEALVTRSVRWTPGELDH